MLMSETTSPMALCRSLARGPRPTTGRATVRRRDGGLRVALHPAEPVDGHTIGRAAVRVVGALRAIDPWARTIDVSAGEPAPAGRGRPA